MPQLRHALLCEAVETHKTTPTVYTIKNVFGAINTNKFPFNFGEFSLVTFWQGDLNEQFNLSFTIISSNGDIIADTPLVEKTVTAESLTNIFAFYRVEFPRPDTYAVNININGISIDKVEFTIGKK